ncbi:MAG: alpha/beta hydrolase [Stenotrophomonas sp.]|jgi:pimeloyl-ACP methyl ester carboxylesterase|uniref:alpha/beta hydrolase n=1 Tax=Stenotrophomonas sp. TaxID=69392 RepID=UPI00284E9C02|nr:alpha/beta hydrolase [Stenotrophomonas sp.]MDR2961667.1 alpha/beta hydrolase [Stenotrophomonas sp.]
MNAKPDFYRDQQAWKDLQALLPEHLRLDDANAPQEEFWNYLGHQVHLDRYVNPDAPAKVILHHGVGTNGRQMSMILGAPLARRGFETVALDNLGYGLTKVAPGTTFSYDDWVDLVVDFIAYERTRDDRPIVLYGLSAGGMLTYHVAAKAPKGALRGIVGMTFLDQRVQQVRDETAHDILTSRIGIPLMGQLAKTLAAKLKYPMTLASKMSALANNEAAMKVFLRDRTSAGNWMSVRFLASYGNYVPVLEPEQFDRCPVLLTQPAEDRWTPLHLSTPLLSRISKVSVETVMLENAGHYPMEEPGLRQMDEAIAAFTQRVCL